MFKVRLTDGENLGTFAFRKALPQLRCYDRDGIGFWVDAVGYASALAYGILIPLGLVPSDGTCGMFFAAVCCGFCSFFQEFIE